jgi:type IV pilus assembly protein PilX
MRLGKDRRPKKRQTVLVSIGSAKQRGAVMIVALMLLLVMTVLAVSGIGNSVLEQKMSGNYYHSVTAFEAAEFGLRAAEKWMFSKVTTASAWETWFTTNTTSNGLYTTQDGSSPNSVEVCGGDINCQFDPLNDSNWCNGGGGCVLPKGFVTLGDTLEGLAVDTYDMPVARQPQFIIEHIGEVKDPSIQVDDPNVEGAETAFRITVIGWGQEGVSRHILQSHVLIGL